MATRRERVIIDLDDRFTDPMARMAASTSMFKHNLDDSRGSVMAFDKTTKDASPSIDKLSGRLAILGRSAAALGPGIVPIAGALVPVVAGLSTQLGFAAAGAGVAVLAFKGLGDAMKAVNEYQINPTAENFAKLEQKLHGLGPAAQDFVFFIDQLGPKLQSLRTAGQDGLLPGAKEGIEALLGRLPQVRRIISEISSTSGDLLAGAGASLASSRWDDFFNFLEKQARPTLIELGHTAGNVAHGLAGLWMALSPMSQDFTGGLLAASKAFDKWATSLSKTQGFEDFLAYVHDTGPQVMATLGSLANALLQIVEAAAPMGGPILRSLEIFADVIAKIADSPIGTPLIAAVGAMSALSLATNTFGKAVDSAAVGKVRGLTADLKTMGSVGVVAWARTEEGAARYAAASQRVGSTLKNIGKQTAVVAGLALATSGLADKTGLANTASFALMGTIAGPWGVAIGGGIGLVKDFASANDDLEHALSAANKAASDPTGLQAQAKALAELRATFSADVNTGGLAGAMKGLKSIGSDLDDKTRNQIHASTVELMGMRNALSEVFAATNHGDLSMLSAPLADVEEFANRISPALQKAGISWDQFLAAPMKAVPAIRAYFSELDTAAGKSRSVGDALKALGNQMESNVSQAGALKSAMDSLFGIQLSQSAATDAWTQGLKDLRKQIDGTNGAIHGTSKAALANRAAIRASVQQLEDKVNADASAGVSGRKLVTSLIRGRDAIIQQAHAAGASKKSVREYLAQLNLTPKDLRTIISTPGMLSAKQQVQALGKLYHLTPKEVRTLLSQPGMGAARSAIADLTKKYHLTPKQVTTLLKAIDQASGTASRVRSIYAGIPRSIATSIITNHVDKFERQTKRAMGGFITGPGTGTSDSIPAYLSNGEYVIKAAAVAKYGTHMFDRLNAMHFAQGGSVQSKDKGPTRSEVIRAHEGHLTAELKHLRDTLQKTRQAIMDLRTSVQQSLTHDPFGHGAAGLLTQLQADANDARTFRGSLSTVRSRGISMGLFKALAESGDVNTAGELAHMSAKQLAAYNSAFANRNYQISATGAFVAGQATPHGTVARLERQIAHLNAELKHFRKEAGKNAREGVRQGMTDKNKATQRRRRAKR